MLLGDLNAASPGGRFGENLQLKFLREVQSDLDEWSTREGERGWKLMNEGSISRRSQDVLRK